MGLYGDNGQEHGNYFNGLYGFGVCVQGDLVSWVIAGVIVRLICRCHRYTYEVP